MKMEPAQYSKKSAYSEERKKQQGGDCHLLKDKMVSSYIYSH